ncbi:MAG TPA: flagellar type III secretion system pore protein FliP [Phycisphaerae bacterium]|jgi:flagellar biosynthetic protein FliP
MSALAWPQRLILLTICASAPLAARADDGAMTPSSSPPVIDTADNPAKAPVTAERTIQRAAGMRGAVEAAWWRHPLAALAMVLGLIVGLTALVRRYFPPARAAGHGVLKVLARTHLAPRQSVVLIQVGRRLLVAGITPENIQPLCVLDDAEENARLLALLAPAQAGSEVFSGALRAQRGQFEAGNGSEEPGDSALPAGAHLQRSRRQLAGLLHVLRTRTAVIMVGGVLALSAVAAAQTGAAAPLDNPLQIPDVRGVLPTASDAGGMSATLQVVIILTLLTLIPSILIMMTSFTRIMIVLALLRQALATPQLPPSQVLLGLSLFMTMLVMAPTWHKIQSEALTPYLNHAPGMTQTQALEIGTGHLREFMYRQIERADNQEDIYLFLEYARGHEVASNETVTLASVPTSVLIPSFIISELKTAFIMGFRMYLPFLVIDMVIATILISMGMMMLPPVLVSLPFKVLLFVLADGWHLVVRTLLASFG